MEKSLKEIVVVTWFTYLQKSTGYTSCHGMEKYIFNNNKKFELRDCIAARPRILDAYKNGRHKPSINRQNLIDEKVEGSKQILNLDLWKILQTPDLKCLERLLQSKSKLLFYFYKNEKCYGYSYIRTLDALVQRNDITALECILCLLLFCKQHYNRKALIVDCYFSVIVILSSLPHQYPYFQPKISDIREMTFRRIFDDFDLPFHWHKIEFEILDQFHSELVCASDVLYAKFGQKFKRANYHYYFQVFAAVEFNSFYWFLAGQKPVAELNVSFKNIFKLLECALPHINKRSGTRKRTLDGYFRRAGFKSHHLNDFFGEDYPTE